MRVRHAAAPTTPASTAFCHVRRSFKRTSAHAVSRTNAVKVSSRQPSGAQAANSCSIASANAAARPTGRDTATLPTRYVASTHRTENVNDAKLIATS